MACGGLNIKVECRDLQPVKEIIAILKMMTEDPRVPLNVREEYTKRVEAVRFEGG